MPFDWQDYFSLASTLNNQEPGTLLEAKCRSAVSRAYYAAFCLAREKAVSKGDFHPTYTGDDHGLIVMYYKNKSEPGIVSKLQSLRLWRNNCDYRNDVRNFTAISNNAITYAKNLLSELDNF
jgi:uncharacterized protein (UPF0332 family)